MSIERKPQNFIKKIGVLSRVSPKGWRVPYPEELEEIVDEPYISPRAYSNDEPLLWRYFYGLSTSPDVYKNKGALKTLSWDKFVFSKGRFLTSVVAFCNQHSEETYPEIFYPPLARCYINQVIDESDRLNRQLTLIEQYDVALNLTDRASGIDGKSTSHRLLDAAVLAHAGSRSAARIHDSRVDPERLAFSKDLMRKWRDCIATFDNITNEYGDPPGDTYHFWQNYVAGLTVPVVIKARDHIFNPIYKEFYNHSAEITKFLRYRRSGHNGNTHKEADVLGLNIGIMVAENILQSDY
jgi:hypothetical protein